MVIAGLQKFTTIDYPGKLACIVFTPGCNMRCPWCHNPSLVENTDELELMTHESVFEFLKSRIGKLDAVVISGGEPTLQLNLEGFIRKVKELGFLVEIQTNGTNPEVIKDLIDKKLLDYVGLDFKVPADEYGWLVPDHSDLFPEWERTFTICKESGIDFEVRTTIHSSFFTKEASFSMAKTLSRLGADKWVWQSFHMPPDGVLDKDLPDGYLNKADVERWRQDVLAILSSLGSKPLEIVMRY